MLVLTRKRDQVISIGDGIEITVLEIKGDQVKLGVSAPREIPVFRKELFQEIIMENRAAIEKTTIDLKIVSGLLKKEIIGPPEEQS